MALDPGNVVQNAIYLSGGTPWPVGFDAWHERARETLEHTAYDYVAGGAGAEETMRANVDAFRRRALRPRMLVGTAERDISVEVLGLRSPAPFLFAPIGVLSIVHPEAERAVAGAARATGVPMVLSSAASMSLEEIASLDPPRWFQLYWWGDPELAESLVRRAEAAGYGAIVLTVDTLTLGWRPRDRELRVGVDDREHADRREQERRRRAEAEHLHGEIALGRPDEHLRAKRAAPERLEVRPHRLLRARAAGDVVERPLREHLARPRLPRPGAHRPGRPAGEVDLVLHDVPAVEAHGRILRRAARRHLHA